MSRFGIVPPEPPANASLDGLAPLFRAVAIEAMSTCLAAKYPVRIREALRSSERQDWLYGFGRFYDDGRGIVTQARRGAASWHFYGLAVDLVPIEGEDRAPPTAWRTLIDVVHSLRLVSGVDWRRGNALGDRPHVQWGNGMQWAPSARAYALYLTGGRRAVWQAVGAIK